VLGLEPWLGNPSSSPSNQYQHEQPATSNQR